MSETKYDIYFKGEILEGFNLISVKAHVGKLFQADADKLTTLFSGKLILLKKDLDKTAAAKYQAAMKKAGARILIKAKTVEAAQASAEPAPEPTPPRPTTTPAAPKPAPAAAPAPETAVEAGLVLSPPGDILRANERKVVEPVSVDISAIQLGAAQDDTPLEAPKPPPPPAPDTSHLDMAEAGSDLLVDKPEEIPVYVPDTSDISIAEAGAMMQDDYEDFVEADIDLSAMSLAEPGAQIGETEKNAPPPPPDTTHIHLK